MQKPNLEVSDEHRTFDLFDYPFSQEIWKSKYSNNGKDKNISDTFIRVAEAISAVEPEHEMRSICFDLFYEVMSKGLFMPAGRILAGAGTNNRVTLVNCFVNRTIEDCMEDIMQANTDAALTMQQGGGMGTDFSTIRPMHARLQRTGSEASGPLPFMDMWNSMCQTIMSAGSRRGAMMGTLKCTHPDLIKFIEAKHEAGRLTNFNISVLITDEFMEAVELDQVWKLHFHEPPAFERAPDWEAQDFIDENNVKQYVYSTHNARELWNLILESTYAYSEPGIIFIDVVNNMNNLQYIENIQCTNPCGEQPLPPYGACNLGAINLAMFVNKPFQKGAEVNYTLLKEVTKIATRFLDNVIDASNYPLEAQRKEQEDKRRVGLGISGLADMLIQLNTQYNSAEAIEITEQVMKTIAEAAYDTSIELAQVKGCFKAFDQDIAYSPFIKRLGFSKDVATKGLRNGVLLTVAPTGTTSIVFGNISSSCEPNFAFDYDRKVLQPDNTWKTSKVESFITRFYEHVSAQYDVDMQTDSHCFITANELKVSEHLAIQAALQKYVDASISKTINCPVDISFEDFKDVYELAYTSGCKGCTTYRPSDIRGSILSTSEPALDAEKEVETARFKTSPISKRPYALQGYTYKIKWPSWQSAIYITINHSSDKRPYEIFFSTKDARHTEWMTGITLLMTALFRLDCDPTFIAKEFTQIVSSHDSAWIEGKNYGSLLEYVGTVLQEHFESMGLIDHVQNKPDKVELTMKGAEMHLCSECGKKSAISLSGCLTCLSCGFSKCG